MTTQRDIEAAREVLLRQFAAMRACLTDLPATEHYQLGEADIARVRFLFDEIEAVVRLARFERHGHLKVVR